VISCDETYTLKWLSSPAVVFWKLFVIGLGICDVCMNFAHLLSILLEDSRALIVTVTGICMSNILSGFNPTLHQLKSSLGVIGIGFADISYSRWAIEAFYLSVLSPYKSIYEITPGLEAWDYKLEDLNMALVIPFVLGFAFKIMTVIAVLVKARI
jgi:hypothetical protein